MNKNKFLFSSLVVVVVIAAIATPAAFAQQTPPQLEKPTTATATESETSSPAFGKITIQISQTEQIVLDLPIKDGNKYQIVPIK